MAIKLSTRQKKSRFPEIHRRINLCYEKYRLATFKKWVFSDKKPCNKKKMAEAGFYFVDTGVDSDCVQCFICDKTLNCWEPNDDPWLEHQKHSPSCYFVKLHKPEIALTISEFIEIKTQVMGNAIKKIQQNVAATAEKAIKLCKPSG